MYGSLFSGNSCKKGKEKWLITLEKKTSYGFLFCVQRNQQIRISDLANLGGDGIPQTQLKYRFLS